MEIGFELSMQKSICKLDLNFHWNLLFKRVGIKEYFNLMYHSVEIIFKKPTICKHRHWNLGIGIGIGTITTSAISSIRPMDTRPSRVILRMRGSQPQNHVTLRYRGNVTDKKHYISTFTKPMDPKLSRVVT